MKMEECIEKIVNSKPRNYSLSEANKILKEYRVLDSKGNVSKQYKGIVERKK